jgi:hypothetical protein
MIIARGERKENERILLAKILFVKKSIYLLALPHIPY